MNTFDNKKISKRTIESVLRTLNKTAIWKLVHDVYGKVDPTLVYSFVDEFAPSAKVSNNAYSIAYERNSNKPKPYQRALDRSSFEFSKENQKHIALTYFKKELARGIDNYTKLPIMGKTHLYFASPMYKHSDYNKFQSMEIKGNERFCEIICKLAEKYITSNNIR